MEEIAHSPVSSQKRSRLSIVLVDDHLLFRQSLKALLLNEPDLEIVGDSGDGREALRLIGRLQPDVAVLDISMPGLGGIDLLPRIHEIAPETETLMLSMHAGSNYVYQAFKAGCRGYILKSNSMEELAQAIRMVAQGETYLSPSITSEFIDHLITKADLTKTSSSLLTPREHEICRLVAQGRNTEQLANDLCISPKTVRVHVANIMKKLSCQSRTELVLRLQEMDTL